MLEGVLERLLLDRLGEYVVLPKDSIQIGVWSGEVVLDNVSLRPSCLTRLKLPVDVSIGRLRKMHIKVPWSSLGSSPVKITLEGLLILAKPAHGAQFDPETAVRLMNDRKIQQLRSAEQLHAQRHWEEDNAQEARQQQSFTQSFISKIIANLQVVLRDVHIRYEDDITFPDRCLATGLLIQEFTALTTNADFEECFISSVDSVVNTFKRLIMRNAALYWDSNAVLLKDHSESAILSAMQESINSLGTIQDETHSFPHTFVLCPVSASMNLTMNSRYFEMNTPHYNFELEISNFCITLHHHQYDDMVCLLDNFSAIQKKSEIEVRFSAIRQHHPHFSPGLSRESAISWWRYACKCIIHLNSTGKRRWFSPASISLYCRQRRKYVELYKRKRNVPWYPPLTDSELSQLTALECELEVEDILFFRTFAETDLAAEARRSKQMLEELRKANQSERGSDWWSTMFGSGVPIDEKVDPDLIRLTDDQRRELYKTIDFKEVTQEFTLRPNHVYSVFSIRVVDASVNLIRSSQYITTLTFQGDAKIELFQGTRFTLSIFSATLQDLYTDGSCFPNIMVFKGEGPFAHFVLEMDPVDSDANIVLNLSLKPVELVYNQLWVQQIIRFFQPVHELSHLRGAALSWSEQRQSEMIVALTNHRVIDVNFSVQHPILFIPKDICSEQCDLLVTDLLSFSLISLRTVNSISDETLYGRPPEPRSAYDAFLLNVHGASVSLCSSSASVEGSLPIRVLERTNCLFGLYTCIDRTSISLAKIVLNGSIPDLNIRLSHQQAKCIGDIWTSHGRYPIFEDVVVGTNTSEAVAVVPLDDLTSKQDDHISSIAVLNRKWFVCSFAIKKLTLGFSNIDGPMVFIDVCGFAFDFWYSLSQSAVQMRLQDVFVQDSRQKGPFSMLMTSKSIDKNEIEHELITVNYTITSRSSPTYQGIDQLIVIEFNSLLVNWNPETVLALMNMIYGTATSPIELSSSTVSVSDSSFHSPIPDSNHIVIRAHLKKLMLSLNKEIRERQLAVGHICDLTVSTDVNRNQFTVCGKLGSFSVTKPCANPSPDHIFRSLVLSSTGSSDLLEFAFDTLRHELPLTDQRGPKFSLKLNSIQFVYLHQFTMELVDYLFQGVLGSVLAQTVSTASDVFLSDYTEADDSASVSLELIISRPRILLPVHSERDFDFIESDLGTISFFRYPQTAHIWQAYVRGEQMKLISHINGTEYDCGRLDLEISISFPYPLQASSFVEVDIVGTHAKASISHEIFILILEVWYNNLMEPALPMQNATNNQVVPKIPKLKSQISYGFDDLNPSQPMKVTFKISKLDVQCIGPDTRHQASLNKDVRLATLTLDGFLLQYGVESDQSYHFDFTINALDIFDSRSRASHSAFQKMVCTNIGTDSSEVGIRFSQDATTTCLTINHPSIFVLPYLTGDLLALFRTSDLIIPSSDIATQPVSDSVDQAPVLSSQFILSVSDSRIIFVQNISNKDSRLITTKSSFNFTIDNELPSVKGVSSLSYFRNKKLLVSELECFVSRGLTLLSSSDRLPVLIPTSFTFSCKDEFVGVTPKSHEILTQLEPISLVLAYEDYQLIMNIYNTIERAFSRSPASTRSSIDSVASGGIISLPETDPDSSFSTITNNAQPEPSVAYSCTIFFDQVKVTGINDCLGRFMPLAMFQTLPFKLLVQGSNLHTRVYASSMLNIQAFNPRITAWEPVLEPCAFEVSIEHIYKEGLASGQFRRTSLPQGRPVTTAVIIDIAGSPSSTSSDDTQTVNINISSSFLETIFGTFRFWSQTQELKETNPISSKSVFSPYYLRNETGDRIVYWLDSDANIRDIVDDGCEVPVKIAPVGLLQATSRSTISFSINLQVHGPWLPISAVKFDKVGIKRFILSPTRNSPFSSEMYLVADCSLLNGIKTITLKSPTVIVNNLNVPIGIYSGDAMPPSQLNNVGSQGFGPIAPGQSLSIPLRLLNADRFFIRPHLNTIQWSQTPFSISSLSRMQANDSILLRCTSSDRTVSPDFLSYVSGQFTNKASPLRGAQIIIMNPFALRNMLALPVSFAIKYQDSTICANGSLNPGDSFFASEFEEDCLPFLLLTVDGFKPLNWIRINPYLVMTDRPLNLADAADSITTDFVEDHLVLTDVTGYPMRIKIEALTGHAALNQYSERAKVVFTISAAYFFLDRTGLGLEIGWTSDNLAVHLIPAQKSVTQPESRRLSYGSLLSNYPISMFGLMPGRDCSIVLRVNGSSDWSSSFNISSVSKDGVLPFVHRPNPESYLVYLEVGVQFDLSPGRFVETKLIQFVPRFILVNNTESDLYFIQPDLPSSLLLVQSHTKSPLYFACSNTQRRISVSLDGETWSGSFLVHEISQSCVKIPNGQTRSNQIAVDARSIPNPVLLDVHIQSARSSIHSFFSVRICLDPPYRIQNLSSLTVQFRQKLDSPFVPGPFVSLSSGESAPFSWDCLAAARPLLLEFRTNSWHGTVPIDDLSFNKRVGVLNSMLRLRVISRGSTKILVVQTSSHQSLTKTQALDIGKKVIDLELSVSVFRICISFIDDRPSELMLLTLSGIEFFLCSSSNICQVTLQIASAQLDNMDWEVGRGALYKYPVVLLQNPQPQATRRPSSQQAPSSSSSHILVRACVLLNRPGIVFLKYFGVLIQESIVEVDEAFYSMANRFFSIANESTCWNVNAIDSISRSATQPGSSKDLAAILQSQNEIDAAIAVSDLQQKTGSLMFFETLELAPIHIIFSFAKQPSGIELNVVSRSFGVAFKNVDSAPIKLEGKLMRNVFVTIDVLLNQLASHYHASVMSRIYTILGSVAVLGNPLGLLSNLGSGLSDFFNDPVDGLVEGNLQGFGQGLKRGSRSLLNQSIYGFGNSLAGISGNLGSGIAALGTSREYRERRAIARARESPDDVLEGIAYGTKNIAYGFADGISGVVIDPLKGAAAQGVSGFFKGVASGAVGLFAKPLTGVLDAVSSVSQGVKNTASIPSRKRSQIRLPRMLYGADRIIREYNSNHAIVQQMIRSIEQGRYANIAYIDHLIIGMVLYVFLNTCILVIKIQDNPDLLEEIPWKDLRVDIDECNIWLKQQARTHSLPNFQDRQTALNVFRVITQAQVQSLQDDDTTYL